MLGTALILISVVAITTMRAKKVKAATKQESAEAAVRTAAD